MMDTIAPHDRVIVTVPIRFVTHLPSISSVWYRAIIDTMSWDLRDCGDEWIAAEGGMRVAHRCVARVARGWLALALVAGAITARPVPAAAAQNVTATTVAELVSALQAAAQAPGTTTITLVAGTTYTVSAPNNGDPTAGTANAFPIIPNGTDVTIIGKGAIIERSAAPGTAEFRLFGISIGGTLRLNDLTLRNGLIRGTQGTNGSAGHAVALDTLGEMAGTATAGRFSTTARSSSAAVPL
jgi:hypothetical protein